MPSRPRPRVCVTLALSSGLACGNMTVSTAVCFLASHILGQQLCPSEPVPGASASPVTKPLAQDPVERAEAFETNPCQLYL